MKITANNINYQPSRAQNKVKTASFCGQIEHKDKKKTKTCVTVAISGLVLAGLAFGFRKKLGEGIQFIKNKIHNIGGAKESILKTAPTDEADAVVKSNLTGSVGLTKRTGSCL